MAYGYEFSGGIVHRRICTINMWVRIHWRTRTHTFWARVKVKPRACRLGYRLGQGLKLG